VDTAYAAARNILVSYARERNSICAAEFTVALMLSVARKIPFAYSALKRGKHLGAAAAASEAETAKGLRADVTWDLGGDTPYVLYKGMQLNGHTLGVIGYGSIGRRVAALCRAFGMKILFYDPYVKEPPAEPDTRQVEMEELLAGSDIVTLHCKDTPQTRGIINARTFERMKPGAFFVNTSRGALVDEEALITALREKKIAGAALDVFAHEPIAKDHPFITELDNIIVTPHIAGATYDAIDYHTWQLTEEIKRFLRAEPLHYPYGN
jgi:D-3-phosphoglycerate dehydrogenase